MGWGTSLAVLRIVRGVGACVLGVFVLWQIVERAGSHTGPTVVHVTAPDVDVFIDGTRYHVKGHRFTPIVTTLPRGRHTLRMSRDGKTLYEETFEIRRRDNGIVLTAWDKEQAQGASALAGHPGAHELPRRVAHGRQVPASNSVSASAGASARQKRCDGFSSGAASPGCFAAAAR